ncbi:MAG: amino acid permease, partial [Myroides sp.]
SSLFFFVTITALNLGSVKMFGEAEFWFSIIKVVAILAMIVFGTYLLISGTGGEQASISNLTNNGGFFPKGWFEKTESGYQGLLSVMAIIMFSFGGLELIGITAAEAENPEKNIPKATNQVIYRILIFYVGALIILFSLSPWATITTETSPFVTVFDNLKGLHFNVFGTDVSGTNLIANVLNLIVLTAALSVYNSSVYSNSRMLYGLAEQGNAPKFVMHLNKSAVPTRAIIVSSCFAGLCIIINKFMPDEAFKILMSLVVSCLIINWIMISFTHLKFRKFKDQANIKTKFPSIIYPVSNYICIVFLLAILAIMSITGMHVSVILIPVWLIILFVTYQIVQKNKQKKAV